MNRKYKGVVKDKDRHGNVRVYLRSAGHPKIRLYEPYGSDAFETELSCARLRLPYKKDTVLEVAEVTATKVTPGATDSFGWLVAEYVRRGMSQLEPATLGQKERILEAVCRETCLSKSGKTTANLPYRKLEKRHIAVLRDEKLATPSAADNRVKEIKAMYNWAIANGLAETNPCLGIKKLKPHTEGHHTMTEGEIEQFEQFYPVGTDARLAFDIGRYTGLRRCDQVLFGRQHLYDGIDEDGVSHRRFKFVPKKTRKKTGVEVDMPVLPPLAASLATAKEGHLTFIINAWGRPFTEGSFGNRFRKWFDEAGLPNCTIHSIRKAQAVIAAENGATASQLMSMFGWKTLVEAERYTQKAQRKVTGSRGAKHLISRK